MRSAYPPTNKRTGAKLPFRKSRRSTEPSFLSGDYQTKPEPMIFWRTVSVGNPAFQVSVQETVGQDYCTERGEAKGEFPSTAGAGPALCIASDPDQRVRHICDWIHLHLMSASCLGTQTVSQKNLSCRGVGQRREPRVPASADPHS